MNELPWNSVGWPWQQKDCSSFSFIGGKVLSIYKNILTIENTHPWGSCCINFHFTVYRGLWQREYIATQCTMMMIEMTRWQGGRDLFGSLVKESKAALKGARAAECRHFCSYRASYHLKGQVGPPVSHITFSIVLFRWGPPELRHVFPS